MSDPTEPSPPTTTPPRPVDPTPTYAAGMLWVLISLIPLSIAALAMWLGLRKPEALITMLPSLAGLGVLLAACLYVLLDNISRARWESRRGIACCRCGYDMREPVSQTCPECGLVEARVHPYFPLWDRMTRTQIVVSIIFVIGGFAIALLGRVLSNGS
jgi:hypothetical protein